MQAREDTGSRRGGLVGQLRMALRRSGSTLARAGSYVGLGMDVVFRWAWVASLATWVFVYPLLRGRQHQMRLDAAYRSITASRDVPSAENRTARYQHQ